ncbi:MAG: 50S ribosomal protein L19e [Candidatus Woesearchaeota archaeon]|nr:50S ribosomal protein L19e [Candidatus Woesearchaeota archaeon]
MTYDLSLQKRLAGAVLKASPHRIVFDPARLNDIKQAITKEDIKGLISDGMIKAKPVKGISRGRARKIAKQKSKGLQKGIGSRKGKATARNPSKDAWMRKVRVQRKFLKELKEKKILNTANYRTLYTKSKGGFFRSVRHIKLFMNEKGMVQNE